MEYRKSGIDSYKSQIFIFKNERYNLLEIKPFFQRLKNEEEIIKLIKIGFKQPRKVLINNLSEKFDKNKIKNVFKKLNLDEKIRPAELSLEMWITINKMLNY